MIIFGNWRFTNKPPHVESEEIKELHKKLDLEQKHRQKEAIQAKNDKQKLKKELAEAKEAEVLRLAKQKETNKEQAIVHLEAAERYFESMELSTGARITTLQALIDKRLEKALNLGFPIKGSITKAILALS